MSIVWGGLAPHPPIIIPEIGRDRLPEAARTVAGMKTLAEDMVAHRCDALIILSPHTPRPSKGITIFCDPMLQGHFGLFGFAQLQYRFLNDIEWIQEFTRHYSRVQLSEHQMLDHGALVPLHYLKEAGWNGPTVVLGLPWNPDEVPAIAQAIAKTCTSTTALLASGDMSHCLQPDAPSGYHPSGRKFDDLFVENLKKAAYQDIEAATIHLRPDACEDVFVSCQLAWQATDYDTRSNRFLSYESPFGVGYSVARLFSDLMP